MESPSYSSRRYLRNFQTECSVERKYDDKREDMDRWWESLPYKQIEWPLASIGRGPSLTCCILFTTPPADKLGQAVLDWHAVTFMFIGISFLNSGFLQTSAGPCITSVMRCWMKMNWRTWWPAIGTKRKDKTFSLRDHLCILTICTGLG